MQQQCLHSIVHGTRRRHVGRLVQISARMPPAPRLAKHCPPCTGECSSNNSSDVEHASRTCTTPPPPASHAFHMHTTLTMAAFAHVQYVCGQPLSRAATAARHHSSCPCAVLSRSRLQATPEPEPAAPPPATPLLAAAAAAAAPGAHAAAGRRSERERNKSVKALEAADTEELLQQVWVIATAEEQQPQRCMIRQHARMHVCTHAFDVTLSCPPPLCAAGRAG